MYLMYCIICLLSFRPIVEEEVQSDVAERIMNVVVEEEISNASIERVKSHNEDETEEGTVELDESSSVEGDDCEVVVEDKVGYKET